MERASARETAMRTAVGAIAAEILEALEISIVGYVSSIGDVTYQRGLDETVDKEEVINSSVGCPDSKASKAMEARFFRQESLKIH